jgi:hypothetical protein
MGGVGAAGGYVAARAGCAFSVSGCIASSLFTLRRRLLKGQIGIISCGVRGRVFHIPRGRSRAKQAEVLEDSEGAVPLHKKPLENGEPRGAQRWQRFTTGDFVTLEKICSKGDSVVAQRTCAIAVKARSETSR